MIRRCGWRRSAVQTDAGMAASGEYAVALEWDDASPAPPLQVIALITEKEITLF